MAAGVFAAAVIFGGVVLYHLLMLFGHGSIRDLFLQTAADLLMAFAAGFLPLFGMVKWHAYLTKKLYEKKIRESGRGWFAGTFTQEFLVTEDQDGERKFYSYHEITSVEETADSYRIAGAGETLTIPKMYLGRDAVRSVRNHLMRYCKDRYEQNFVEEEDGLRLVIPQKAEAGYSETEKDYMRYVRGRYRFYYTETKMWLLGLCLGYLLRLAAGDLSFLSIEARVGLALAVLVIPVSRGILLLVAKRAVKKSRQRKQQGLPAVLEIGKDGFYYQNDGTTQGNTGRWISWKGMKEICEGEKFIVIGNVYFDKRLLTGDQMGQIRALCQKYGGRKYHFTEVRPQSMRDIARTFAPLLCYAVLVAAVSVMQNGWAAGRGDGSRIEEIYENQPEEEQQGSGRKE